jgi:CubicO group peptidase (beta-lactamase class C family)
MTLIHQLYSVNMKQTKYIGFLALLLFSCGEPTLKNEIRNFSEEREIALYGHVEKGTKTLVESAFGYADKEFPLLNDSATNLASLSKLFTQILVVQADYDSVLDLDSTIYWHCPKLDREFAHQITVRQLLTMQSGLPRELQDSTSSLPLVDDSGSCKTFMESLPELELQFAPGTDEAYSNLSYWLLGYILEIRTGLMIDSLLSSEITKPYQLHKAGYLDKSKVAPSLSQNEGLDVIQRYTSGGFHSSANDLAKLLHQLEKEAWFLSYRDMIFGEDNKLEIFGSLPGYTNMLLFYPDESFTAIVLSNTGFRDLDDMSDLRTMILHSVGLSTGESGGNKITVRPFSELNDSIEVEAAMIQWNEAMMAGDAHGIYTSMNKVFVKGSLDENDPTWEAMAELLDRPEKFQPAGFLYKDESGMKGIEAWYKSEGEAVIGFFWIYSKSDTTSPENILIKPVDMEFMGENY